MSKLWMTGASGTLGTHILKHWVNVASVVNSSENKFEQLVTITRGGLINEYSNVSNLNYEEFYNLENEASESGVMLHLAFARTTDNKDIMDSIRLLEDVVEQCKNLNIGTIINISSQSVYDSFRAEAAREEDLPKPAGIYGLAKFYSEKYLEEFAKQHDIKVINIRLAALIGPGLEKRISTRLLKSAIVGGQIAVTSNEEQFSFLDLRDAARMIFEFAQNVDKSKETIYNLGTDEALTLREMADVISRVVQEQGLPEPKVEVGESSGKQYNNSVNLELLKRDFGIEAEISFYEAMKFEFERIKEASDER